VQLVLFPVPAGVFLRGVIIGGLTALVALGMALIYRANRILNFAQADLGGPPAVIVYMLITASGVNYFVALGAGLAASVVLGALVELAIIRRFFRAPRLILTVVTLGLTQLLAVTAILLPKAWGGARLLAPRIDAPFDLRFEVSPIIFTANDVMAIVVVPIALLALAYFLRWTAAGVAIRASAESADRASLLGVPVKRLHTTVWALAALLAFVALFLRAGILGLPVTAALSLGILLRSLAALMLGRLTNLIAIATSAVALGVLETGIASNAESSLLIDPILAVVIVLALLVRRRSVSRVDDDESSTWQAAEEVRPIPPELARLAEVRAVRAVVGTVIVLFAVLLPHFLPGDKSLKASAVLIYGILGISLVVLTGWAGQVSLGQIAFFAVGAVTGAKLIGDWELDFMIALVAATAVGAAVAVIVGLPALRLRGLYLAVTTFAFSLATTSYLLNRRFFDWIPTSRVPRRPVFGRIDIASPTRMYYLALIGLMVAVLAVRGIRRSRTGRVLIALRENERTAQAVGVSTMRAKLMSFAISGAIASYAGCIFVQHQQAFGEGPYFAGASINVFTMVVIGGIASVPGAVIGAFVLQSATWFLSADWRLLITGGGIVLVLLVFPSGLGGVLFKVRDQWLRWVAARHKLVVPSLVADVAVSPPPVAASDAATPTAPQPSTAGVAGSP
jgi:branched-chain amino acid transport system permease protein